MTSTEPIQRVKVYLRENDRLDDQTLYQALLDLLRREGASGATALRGLAGFGPSDQLGASRSGSPADNLPVVVEWIDRAERVTRLLPLLAELAPEALITVETIQIYRAALRAGGPFPAETTCGAVAGTPPTLQPEDRLEQAAEQIATHGALAVLDANGLAVGMLSASDLTRRGGLRLTPRLLLALNAAERAQLLEPVAERRVAELMTTQPRCVGDNTPLVQAAATMVEWGFRQLPVLDRAGRYQGLLTLDNLLAAATPPDESSGVTAAGQATTVALIMQTAVPQVEAGASLVALIERLLASPTHYSVVTDGNQVHGAISDTLLLQRLSPELRSPVVQVFAATAAEALPQLSAVPLRAGDLATPSPTIDQGATLFAAIKAMLGHELEWLPVTAEGRLSGLLSRPGLLRALAQEGAR